MSIAQLKASRSSGGSALELGRGVSQEEDPFHLSRPLSTSRSANGAQRSRDYLTLRILLEEGSRVLDVFPIHLSFEELYKELIPVLGSGFELLEESQGRGVNRDTRHTIGGHHTSSSFNQLYKLF